MAWLIVAALAGACVVLVVFLARAQYEAFTASALYSAALFDDKLRASLAEELQSKMEAIPPRDPDKLSSKVARAATVMAIQRFHSGELSRQAFPVHWGVYKGLVERRAGLA